MKMVNVLFLFLAGAVFSLHAMWYMGPEEEAEMKASHQGSFIYIRMKSRLDVAAKYALVGSALRREIGKLNSDNIFISVNLYQRIQARVKEIEADAGMKHISNDRLPIKKVKTVLYDEEFDLSCLKQKVNAHNGTSVLLHLVDRLDRIKKKSKLDVYAVEKQLSCLHGLVISHELYTTLLERVSEIEGSVGIKNSSDDDDTLPVQRVEDWELDDWFFDLDCFDLIVYPEV